MGVSKRFTVRLPLIVNVEGLGEEDVNTRQDLPG